MGDVGGEHLDRLDAVIERVRHVAQRAGEMADLVAAAGEIGNLDAGADAAADALGAVGEPAHRSGDGARQQQRQHDHHRRSDAADFQDREPLGGDHLVDVVALGRKHQRAVHCAEALHRHRDRDDHLAALVDAHHAALLAAEGLRDLP